jgi:hypothetical protein
MYSLMLWSSVSTNPEEENMNRVIALTCLAAVVLLAAAEPSVLPMEECFVYLPIIGKARVIAVSPGPGEHFACNPDCDWADVGCDEGISKVLMQDYELEYEPCPFSNWLCDVSAGDPTVAITAHLYNESPKDYWVIVYGSALDSEGQQVSPHLEGSIVPVCGGPIPLFLSGKQTDTITLHFKASEDITLISIRMPCTSEIPPP